MSRFVADEPPPPTQSFDLHFLRNHPLAYVVTHPPFVLGVLILALLVHIMYQHSLHRQELHAVCSQLRQTKHNTEILMQATGDGERKMDVVSEQLEYLRERWENGGLGTTAAAATTAWGKGKGKAEVQAAGWVGGEEEDMLSVRTGLARVVAVDVDLEDMDGGYVGSDEDG